LWPGSSMRAQTPNGSLLTFVRRFAKFNLELAPRKRPGLIEFGRFAAKKRRSRPPGLGKPETFDFLGFTHICGKTRNGRFQLKAHSRSQNGCGSSSSR